MPIMAETFAKEVRVAARAVHPGVVNTISYKPVK
jgi:hypothetical protein